jgi:hypothetical protein
MHNPSMLAVASRSLIRPAPDRGMAAIEEDQGAVLSAGRIAVGRAIRVALTPVTTSPSRSRRTAGRAVRRARTVRFPKLIVRV